MIFTFVTEGRCAPQGSKRALGPGRMIEMSKYVKPWREAVKNAAIDRKKQLGLPYDVVFDRCPVELRVTFWAKRPKSHYRTGKHAAIIKDSAPTYVNTTPDLSKLLRSTEDAISSAGIWHDDNQVVHHNSWHKYSDTGFEGAEIEIKAVT